MSDKKIIQFTESFLTLNKTRKSVGKKEKKNKPTVVIKPTTLRKTLLEKIKKHQQDEKIKNYQQDEKTRKNPGAESTELTSKEDKVFNDDFLNSMEYLEKISEQKKHHNSNKRRKNKTLKKTNNQHNNNNNEGKNRNTTYPDLSQISIDLPPNFDDDNITNNITNNVTSHNRLHGGMNVHTPTMSLTPMPYVPMPYVPMPYVPMPSVPMPSVHTMPSVHPMPLAYPILPIQQYNTEPYNNDNTNININTPQFGCLKGGNKPTYRQFHNKTLKKSSIRYNMSKNTRDSTTYSDNNNNNKNSRINIQTNSNNNNRYHKSKHNKIKQRTRHTKKTTFKLGKYGGNVSVLIKNNATRRKIKREHSILKQKPITEIKKFLYDKNLLKLGSVAPNDVLRTLYEESILAGDITNINNDVTLHNFLQRNTE